MLQDTKGNLNWECGIDNGSEHLLCPVFSDSSLNVDHGMELPVKLFPLGKHLFTSCSLASERKFYIAIVLEIEGS